MAENWEDDEMEDDEMEADSALTPESVKPPMPFKWLRLMDLREPFKHITPTNTSSLVYWRFCVGKHNVQHFIGWTDDGQMVDLTK